LEWSYLLVEREWSPLFWLERESELIVVMGRENAEIRGGEMVMLEESHRKVVKACRK